MRKAEAIGDLIEGLDYKGKKICLPILTKGGTTIISAGGKNSLSGGGGRAQSA